MNKVMNEVEYKYVDEKEEYAPVEAACKILVKLTPGVDFTSMFTGADPNRAKNTVKSSMPFCPFGIFACKSCSIRFGEIYSWSQS